MVAALSLWLWQQCCRNISTSLIEIILSSEFRPSVRSSWFEIIIAKLRLASPVSLIVDAYISYDHVHSYRHCWLVTPLILNLASFLLQISWNYPRVLSHTLLLSQPIILINRWVHEDSCYHSKLDHWYIPACGNWLVGAQTKEFSL